MDLPERDWKHLRGLHQVALERYCTRVLDEIRTLAADETGSAHDRYLRLYRMLQERDRALATAFDDMRRTMAIPRLAAILNLGVITEEELAGFSAPTRDSALSLKDLLSPQRKRRRQL